MKKIFVIGLDALSPKLVQRFARDGTCPNFKRIMENGGFSKVLSAVPAQTPENWTTLATGSMPGTHGIAVWGRHSYGEPVTENYGNEAMSSNLCKAEYLWETAARQGLKSVLLYFIGYPPTTDKVVHMDWFWHPTKFYFEICRNACYVNKDFFSGKIETPRSKEHSIEVTFEQAEGWANIPRSKAPLETKIEITPKLKGRGVTYYALLLDSDGQGYQKCLISKSKDGSQSLCSLRAGEWSEWFKERFIVEDVEKIGTVRFKLIELSADGKSFRLYRSQVYPVEGFSYPEETAEELIAKFGPYINEAVSSTFFLGRAPALVDKQTFREELEYQINWVSKAAKYLMDKHESSIYMMHWHLPDMLAHNCLGSVDPAGGKYDSAKADKAWEMLKLGYSLADELVGKFLKYVDDDNYLIVASDHGNSPNRKRYSISRALADKGLIEVEEDEGTERINWFKSKVFVDLTNVYVNLKSKYAGGIVEDTQYEAVRREVIDALRSCKDEDGEYPVAFAFRKEDAPMIGLWGPHVGDVVFVYSSGFTWGMGLQDREAIVGGANHGPQLPTTETDISSNYATYMIIGKDVKKGYVRPVNSMGPVQIVDIASTISYILDIEPPRHCQGRILHDFFRGWDVSEIERERKALKFPERTVLVGDVTDIEVRPQQTGAEKN